MYLVRDFHSYLWVLYQEALPVLLYIRYMSKIPYPTRDDLMTADCASIWLEVSCNKGRKILVGNIYREFQILGQTRGESASQESQLERFTAITKNWEKAGGERDTILLGDLNIDFKKWDSSTGFKAKLVDLVKKPIVQSGFVQLVNEYTWFQPGKCPAILDQIWCNNLHRIVQVQILSNARSDHNVVIARVKNWGR